MPEISENRVNDIIVTAMDGRANKWLQERLEQKGISLNAVQMSQRLSGITQWTGNEALACFEILNINVSESAH